MTRNLVLSMLSNNLDVAQTTDKLRGRNCHQIIISTLTSTSTEFIPIIIILLPLVSPRSVI